MLDDFRDIENILFFRGKHDGRAICSHMPELNFDNNNGETNAGKNRDLDGLNTNAKVTVLVLVNADHSFDCNIVKKYEMLAYNMLESRFLVNVVFLNGVKSSGSRFPSCLTKCKDFQRECESYKSLLVSQKLPRSVDNTSFIFPLYQDTSTAKVWDKLNGRAGDVYVYDQGRHLFAYLTTNQTRNDIPVDPNILNPDGFTSIRTIMLLTIFSNHNERCIEKVLIEDITSTSIMSTLSTNGIYYVFGFIILCMGIVIGLFLHPLFSNAVNPRRFGRRTSRRGGRGEPRFVELPTTDDGDPEMDDELHGLFRGINKP